MKSFKSINYQIDDKEIIVYFDELDNAYLTQKEICKLLGKSKSNISEHLKTIISGDEWFGFSELNPINLKVLSSDGRRHETKYCPLDLVVQIGYRVNSNNALKLKELIDNKYEIIESNLDKVIIYNNDNINLNVRISPEEKTVWLNQDEICLLYDVSQSTVSEHIKNILSEEDFSINRTYRNFRYVAPEIAYFKTLQVSKKEGERTVTRTITYYNLDMILAIGYRVKTAKASLFRKWVSDTLSQYLLKGYIVNPNRLLPFEENLKSLTNELKDMHLDIKRLLDSNDETLIQKGQYFDGYVRMCEIVANATKEIIIIDTYFDLEGLKILAKSKPDIIRKIYLNKPNQLYEEDIQKFRQQYGSLELYLLDEFHDRFIIIDRQICYSIGTSFNSIANKTSLNIKVKTDDTLEKILKLLN